MTINRIYTVVYGDTKRLVRAANQAQAIRHVASDTFKCHVASQDDCINLVAQGVTVEDAGAGEKVRA